MEKINNRISPIQDEYIEKYLAEKELNLTATLDGASAYREADFVVIAVPVEKVTANDYNPNVVAPPEMKLLELSIWEDGFSMPCVCYYDKENDKYITQNVPYISIPQMICRNNVDTLFSRAFPI